MHPLRDRRTRRSPIVAILRCTSTRRVAAASACIRSAELKDSIRGQADRADRRRTLSRHRRGPRSRLRHPQRRRHRPRRAARGPRRRERGAHPLRDQDRRRGDRRRPSSSRSSPAPASASTTSTSRRRPTAGVMVVNAPTSNIISAAELTDRPHPEPRPPHPGRPRAPRRGGVEALEVHRRRALREDVGIIGLGRIGALIAARLQAFGVERRRLRPLRHAARAPSSSA